MYSREQLIPEAIIKNLPFKQTHEALRDGDNDALKQLLCSFVKTLAIKIYQYVWASYGDNKEKKRGVLKSLVYLDALITLYRMPNAFQFAMDDLSERFRNIPEQTLLTIIDKFCNVSVADSGAGDRFEQRIAAQKRSNPADQDGKTQFKFLKSKESVKSLILNIIGVVVHLSTRGVSKVSFLQKILKRDINELKNYFRELGLTLDPITITNEESGEKFEDFKVSFRGTNRQNLQADKNTAAET